MDEQDGQDFLMGKVFDSRPILFHFVPLDLLGAT